MSNVFVAACGQDDLTVEVTRGPAVLATHEVLAQDSVELTVGGNQTLSIRGPAACAPEPEAELAEEAEPEAGPEAEPETELAEAGGVAAPDPNAPAQGDLFAEMPDPSEVPSTTLVD